MWGRVIQTDLVTWSFKAWDHVLHIMCKKDEGIVKPNFDFPATYENPRGGRYPPPSVRWLRSNFISDEVVKRCLSGVIWAKKFHGVLCFPMRRPGRPKTRCSVYFRSGQSSGHQRSSKAKFRLMRQFSTNWRITQERIELQRRGKRIL